MLTAEARLMNRNAARTNGRPWWADCPPDELQAGIARVRRALPFCRGRAADIRAHVEQHLACLESFARGEGYRATQTWGCLFD